MGKHEEAARVIRKAAAVNKRVSAATWRSEQFSFKGSHLSPPPPVPMPRHSSCRRSGCNRRSVTCQPASPSCSSPSCAAQLAWCGWCGSASEWATTGYVESQRHTWRTVPPPTPTLECRRSYHVGLGPGGQIVLFTPDLFTHESGVDETYGINYMSILISSFSECV